MLALANHVSPGRSAAYAIGADFCRIFTQDMNSLYLLSFLLTADREKAEECFASGLEDSVTSNRVFKEWARSWARRTVIRSAIRMIEPTSDRAREKTPFLTTDRGADAKSGTDASLAAVLALGAFERFVFVMSFLEHYSDQECSILLGCSQRDVALARGRAAERIAGFVESNEPRAVGGAEMFTPELWLAETA
jgi:DNA-directed RNA polymerase specialized sigma24 family protein